MFEQVQTSFSLDRFGEESPTRSTDTRHHKNQNKKKLRGFGPPAKPQLVGEVSVNFSG
jgi:hypothetical protein